jgi:2-(1,2-epoxy-1,2-dihydrophenyl)acetyl-CoA isomerase
MMILGERIAAERALAGRLAAGPTVAYGLMRQATAAGLESSLTETLALERANQRAAGRTSDHAEGVMAFLEKRKPAFRGK